MGIKRYIDSKEIMPGRERPNLGYLNLVRERTESLSLQFRLFLSSTDRPVKLEVGEVMYFSRVFDDARVARQIYEGIDNFSGFVEENDRVVVRDHLEIRE